MGLTDPRVAGDSGPQSSHDSGRQSSRDPGVKNAQKNLEIARMFKSAIFGFGSCHSSLTSQSLPFAPVALYLPSSIDEGRFSSGVDSQLAENTIQTISHRL